MRLSLAQLPFGHNERTYIPGLVSTVLPTGGVASATSLRRAFTQGHAVQRLGHIAFTNESWVGFHAVQQCTIHPRFH